MPFRLFVQDRSGDYQMAGAAALGRGMEIGAQGVSRIFEHITKQKEIAKAEAKAAASLRATLKKLDEMNALKDGEESTSHKYDSMGTGEMEGALKDIFAPKSSQDDSGVMRTLPYRPSEHAGVSAEEAVQTLPYRPGAGPSGPVIQQLQAKDRSGMSAQELQGELTGILEGNRIAQTRATIAHTQALSRQLARQEASEKAFAQFARGFSQMGQPVEDPETGEVYPKVDPTTQGVYGLAAQTGFNDPDKLNRIIEAMSKQKADEALARERERQTGIAQAFPAFATQFAQMGQAIEDPETGEVYPQQEPSAQAVYGLAAKTGYNDPENLDKIIKAMSQSKKWNLTPGQIVKGEGGVQAFATSPEQLQVVDAPNKRSTHIPFKDAPQIPGYDLLPTPTGWRYEKTAKESAIDPRDYDSNKDGILNEEEAHAATLAAQLSKVGVYSAGYRIKDKEKENEKPKTAGSFREALDEWRRRKAGQQPTGYGK